MEVAIRHAHDLVESHQKSEGRRVVVGGKVTLTTRYGAPHHHRLTPSIRRPGNFQCRLMTSFFLRLSLLEEERMLGHGVDVARTPWVSGKRYSDRTGLSIGQSPSPVGRTGVKHQWASDHKDGEAVLKAHGGRPHRTTLRFCGE